MSTWWKTRSDDWVNGDAVAQLEAFQLTDGTWGLTFGGTTNPKLLKGTYASAADAREAARKLCQGIDPITITGGV